MKFGVTNLSTWIRQCGNSRGPIPLSKCISNSKSVDIKWCELNCSESLIFLLNVNIKLNKYAGIMDYLRLVAYGARLIDITQSLHSRLHSTFEFPNFSVVSCFSSLHSFAISDRVSIPECRFIFSSAILFLFLLLAAIYLVVAVRFRLQEGHRTMSIVMFGAIRMPLLRVHTFHFLLACNQSNENKFSW